MICDQLDALVRIRLKLGFPIVDATGLALKEAVTRKIDMVVQRATTVGTRLRRLAGSPAIKP